MNGTLTRTVTGQEARHYENTLLPMQGPTEAAIEHALDVDDALLDLLARFDEGDV